MNRLLRLAILSSAFGAGAPAPARPPLPSPQNTPSARAQQVQQIRRRYAYINANLSKYRRVTKQVQESTEGGVREAYFEGRQIRRIMASDYGETGQRLREFYFWNNRLIFSFERFTQYARPIQKTAVLRILRQEENRNYFHHGRMLRWIKDGIEVIPLSNPGYNRHTIALLTTANDMLTLLRS